MEIQNNKLLKPGFSFNPSLQDIDVEVIELDLSKKQNLFSNPQIIRKNPPLVEKKSAPVKRLNAMDNEFFVNEDLVAAQNASGKAAKKTFLTSDFKQLLKSMKTVVKNIGLKLPVIGYFLIKDKHLKLKTTLKTLSDINDEVDELMKCSTPFGEQPEIYSSIARNLLKANNIHSQIVKDIE